MNLKKTKWIVTGIVFLSLIVLSIRLGALAEFQCRGTDSCSEIYDACTDGDPFLYSQRIVSGCYSDMECITLITVACVDSDAVDEGEDPLNAVYFRSVECWSPAGIDECNWN